MARPVAATNVEFRLLGPLEVLVDGRTLPLSGAQQRALLALLLLHANVPVSTDRLVEELWGERAPRTAAASLRVAVGKLRALLGDEHRTRLETVPGGYRLRVEREELDATRFESLVTEARTRPPRDAVVLLEEALALWRGPPLADQPYSPFAQSEVRRLSELELAAREHRIEAELALGHHARVVPELESLVAEHPLRERVRAQLMLALYRSGRQADALEVYKQGRSTLRAELGLEPSEELRRLEQEILNQSPDLGAAEDDAYEGAPRTMARTRPRAKLAILVTLLFTIGVLSAFAWYRARSSPAQAAVPVHSLVSIDARTNAVTRIPLGWTPSALALGGHALWALDREHQIVARIDLHAGRVEQIVGLGVAPSSVSIGAGAVWVLGSERGVVLRIDPAFGTVRGSRRIPFGSAPDRSIGDLAAIAAGAHTVWVEDGFALSRLDPATGTVVHRIPLGAELGGVAVGAGSVWVIRGDPAMLLRIDPRTNRVIARIALALRRGGSAPFPIGVAPGSGGIWVLNGNTGTVSRVDPALDAIVATVSRVSLDATRIAAGDGAVWVADVDGDAVLRIDPATNRVVRSIPLGGTPKALVAGRSGVWVAVDST